MYYICTYCFFHKFLIAVIPYTTNTYIYIHARIYLQLAGGDDEDDEDEEEDDDEEEEDEQPKKSAQKIVSQVLQVG